MNKDDIITLPNPHLRARSKKARPQDEKTIKLVADMTAASIDWENSRPFEISAALAAVQIDRLERVVIIREDFDNKENPTFVPLINPEIIKYEGEEIEDFEGCLSVKDTYGRVKRWSKIRVKVFDLEGNELRFKAEGFLARVIQHEVDHTNGIVFIDHIKGQKDAFFRLNDKGEFVAQNYEKDIKNNAELWDEHED